MFFSLSRSDSFDCGPTRHSQSHLTCLVTRLYQRTSLWAMSNRGPRFQTGHAPRHLQSTSEGCHKIIFKTAVKRSKFNVTNREKINNPEQQLIEKMRKKKPNLFSFYTLQWVSGECFQGKVCLFFFQQSWSLAPQTPCGVVKNIISLLSYKAAHLHAVTFVCHTLILMWEVLESLMLISVNRAVTGNCTKQHEAWG